MEYKLESLRVTYIHPEFKTRVMDLWSENWNGRKLEGYLKFVLDRTDISGRAEFENIGETQIKGLFYRAKDPTTKPVFLSWEEFIKKGRPTTLIEEDYII